MKIKYWILRRLFKYTSPLISIFEKSKVNKYSNKVSEKQAIFILGAPRTGSTILYQLLTQYFDLQYFDNLNHLANENVYFGSWLSSKIFKGKPHNCFKSKHGRTIDGGLHAPTEGGQIWQRWLPSYDNYLDVETVSDKQIILIRKNIYSLINRYNKPLIIKNNYNSLRLKLIKKFSPNAKFIFIKRDPLYTAQSIIIARENIYNDRSMWWSIKPSNYMEIGQLSYVEQVVKQIYYIEKQIHIELKMFDLNNILVINYNDLNNQKEFLDTTKKFLKNVKVRENIDLQEIRISKKNKLEEEIIKDLKKEIQKYDWENYSS